jgi:hypothetical protein
MRKKRDPLLNYLLGKAWQALNLTHHKEAVRLASCDCEQLGSKAALEEAMPHFLPGNEELADAIREFIRRHDCP